MNNKNKGIFFLITSSFFFAVSHMLIKLTGEIPTVEKALVRNIIATLISFIVLYKAKEKGVGISHFLPQRKTSKVLWIRVIFGTMGMLFTYYTVDHLNLADASMLGKMAPFFMVILSYIFLKEKINSYQIGAIVVAFFGAMFVIKPTFSVEILPYIIGLLGSFFAAGAYTCVRYISVNGERSSIIIFYFSFFALVFFSFLSLFNFVMPTIIELIVMTLAGVCVTVAQYALTKAYSYAPSKEISVYDYTQIVFTAILGYITFGEIPDGYSIIGYFIIIGSGVFLFLYDEDKINKRKLGR